jgi:hypothetical protein
LPPVAKSNATLCKRPLAWWNRSGGSSRGRSAAGKRRCGAIGRLKAPLSKESRILDTDSNECAPGEVCLRGGYMTGY